MVPPALCNGVTILGALEVDDVAVVARGAIETLEEHVELGFAAVVGGDLLQIGEAILASGGGSRAPFANRGDGRPPPSGRRHGEGERPDPRAAEGRGRGGGRAGPDPPTARGAPGGAPHAG